MPKRRAEQVEEPADGNLASPEEQGKVSGYCIYYLST